jgi:hypothetical protein
MAIIGQVTVNQISILEIDADPRADGGLAAPIGSIASMDNGSGSFLKVGSGDTDWKLSVRTPLTEDLDVTGHKIIGLSSATTSNEPATYGQLLSFSGGSIWLDPVQAISFINDSLSTPPGTPVVDAVYLVNTSPTGAWTGLAGHLVHYTGSAWVDEGLVAIGQRLIVTGEDGSGSEGGSCVGNHNKILTVTNATPGSYAYTTTNPADKNTVFDNLTTSPDFGHTYNYQSGSSSWVEIPGAGGVLAGNAIGLSGNTINVQYNNTEITLNGSNQLQVGSIDKSKIGLGNVDNTSDVNKPISTATQTALNSKVSGDGAIAALGVLTGDPMGFVNRTDSNLSFSDSTKQLTISVKSPATSYDFYVQGTKFTKSSSISLVIPTVGSSGKYFFWFDNTGTLTVGAVNVPWNIALVAPVALVYWNATTGKGFVMEERHGIVMDWATHLNLHSNYGTQLQTSMPISGYTLNTDTVAAVTIGLGTGRFADEDIQITTVDAASPSNPFEQILTDPAKIPVFYRSGSAGDWVWDAPDSAGLFTKRAAGGNNRLALNDPSGPWTQTELNSTNYMNYYIVAVPMYCYGTGAVGHPIICIQGQNQTTTLAAAQLLNFSDLNLGTLPFEEMVPLYKVTFNTQTSFSLSTNRSRIQAITNISKLSSPASGAISATDHNSLGGRSNPNSHPASAISNTPSGNITSVDVQSALNELDDIKFTNGGDSFGGTANIGTNDANTLNIKTNNAIRMAIDSSGNAAINTSIDATQQLKISQSPTATSGTTAGLGYYVTPAPTSASTNSVYGELGSVSYSGTNINSGINMIGSAVSCTYSGSASGPSPTGGQFFATNAGTGGSNGLTGVLAQTDSNGGANIGSSVGLDAVINGNTSGTITNAYGVRSTINCFSSPGVATITSAYGLKTDITKAFSGAIGTAYGLYIGSVQATTPWSIYSSSSTVPSAFAGSVSIGQVSIPTAKLHLGPVSAAAGSASLKLASGTLMSSAEDGAFEYDGTHLYFTSGSRKDLLNSQIAGDVTGTVSATTVAKIQGRTVSSSAPTNGQVLAWNNGTSQWEPTTDNDAITLSGDVTGFGTGTITTALSSGVVTNTNISASAAIALSKLATVTASRALVSSAGGLITAATTTSTEIGFVNGVTSAIQTQLNGKEPTITAGTTAQYWRGDKSWQTLNSTAVGLGNVNNTADTSKTIAGDVTGTLGASTVAKIQGRTVASTAPANTQVIAWNNGTSQWEPTNATAGPSGDIRWLGAWNSGTSYVQHDAVQYQGSSYHCDIANLNSAPPNANWSLIASKGDQGPAGTFTNNEASATGSTTTTSSTPAAITTMTVTPGAGTYLVIFSGRFTHSSISAEIAIDLRIAGTQQAHTLRTGTPRQASGSTGQYFVMSTNAILTVADAQAIAVYWSTTSGTAGVTNRTLDMVKIA